MIQKGKRRFAAAECSCALLRYLLLPVLLLATPGTLAWGAQFTLTWTDNSTNESGFRIERAAGLNATSGFTQIATVGANVVSYVNAGLPNSTSYTYRLRAYNSAGASGYSNVASGTTPPPTSNSAPTITDIADQTVTVNGTTSALAFRISDSQTAASSLTLIKNASNRTLIPLANISFGGSGNNRTVTVRPASNQTGYSTVWIKVSDGKLTNYIGFVVTVKSGSGNTAPSISGVGSRTIAVNGTTGPIAFSIGDSQTSASSLTLIRNVSNPAVIPLANVTLGGSGANRTVTVRPAANRTGWSTVWVKVSDGQLQSCISFVVNVTASLTASLIEPAPTMIASTSQSQLASSMQAAETSGGDRLHFSHLALAGDSELTVRVDALRGTSDDLRGGLMFRGSIAPDDACAGVYLTAAGRLLFVWRSRPGEALQTVAPSTASTPQYLRLTRAGGMLYGFASSDGLEWDLVEFASVTLPASALAGTAVMTPDNADESAVVFSGFAVD